MAVEDFAPNPEGEWRHPWWPANERWLAANRDRLRAVDRPEFALKGNQMVVEGAAAVLWKTIGLWLGFEPERLPTEEVARGVLTQQFLELCADGHWKLAKEVVGGLLESADGVFENLANLRVMRHATDDDMDHGIHDLIDDTGTAQAAAKTARAAQIEKERAARLAIIRAGSAINFEVARSLIATLRRIHVVAYGDEGSQPPGGPLGRAMHYGAEEEPVGRAAAS